MSEKKTDPIRPTDDDARALARTLIGEAQFCALAVLEPETGSPMVTRVGFGTGPNGTPMTLISSLAQHTGALRVAPACSLLLGEPEDKGDPLTHPRVTLQCRARFVSLEDAGRPALRAQWLQTHPKAKLYIDFADFAFALFDVQRAFLNGGFGKAYVLDAADLGLPPS